MQDEYEDAFKGDMVFDNIVKLGELNELAYEDLFYQSTPVPPWKVAFGLVRNVKTADFLEGNTITWDRLLSMYVPHTYSSLLKLKSEFHKSHLRKIQTRGSQIRKSFEF